MLVEKLKNYNIILASKSPRRQELFKGLDIDYTVKTKDTEETYPTHLSGKEIALYLAEIKAKAFENELSENDLLITCDTVVCVGNEVLEKSGNFEQARKMLEALSGKEHQVITGVCLKSITKTVSFSATTIVNFKELSTEEIEYYINKYKPFDKAGSYGIQEWIGFIGIKEIKGTYFNVMGLPLYELYEELTKFVG